MPVDIRIESGPKIAGAATLLKGEGPLFLLYDKAVEPLAASLREQLDFKAFLAVEGGEGIKSFGAVEGIISWLMGSQAGRDAILVIMGGGSVCDAGAFCSSIYKRGIRFALLPTTLLSQVDAAIGGKTGINFGGVKNSVGTFSLPLFTYICPESLLSLPKEEWISGAAELLKTTIISGKGYDEAVTLLKSGDRSALAPAILAAARFKAGIVSEDLYDYGKRRLLNLGHTYGHAIESCALAAGRPVPHGHAVAIGMVISARKAGSPFADRLSSDLQAIGLPTECKFTEKEILPYIRQDKKMEDGGIRFILLHGPGRLEEVKLHF